MDVIIIQVRHWSELLFCLFWGRFIHLFASVPTQRHLVRIFFMFIRSHFVSDFSFCYKDALFGLFDYSKEKIGKCNFFICFLLAKFHIHEQKHLYIHPMFPLKGIVHPKTKTLSLITHACRSKPVRPSFIFRTQIKMFLMKSESYLTLHRQQHNWNVPRSRNVVNTSPSYVFRHFGEYLRTYLT